MNVGTLFGRALSLGFGALLFTSIANCVASPEEVDIEADVEEVQAEGDELTKLSGFVSFHQEYTDIPTIGQNVTCAPDAFSVPDWDTRFTPSKFGFMVAALQSTVFDKQGKAASCAQCAKVTSKKTGKSVTVRIIDRSTDTFNNGGKRFLDLSVTAFKKIGNTADGVIPADISFVSCPSNLK